MRKCVYVCWCVGLGMCVLVCVGMCVCMQHVAMFANQCQSVFDVQYNRCLSAIKPKSMGRVFNQRRANIEQVIHASTYRNSSAPGGGYGKYSM